MAVKYIPDDVVNEVRNQADIVEIISEYVNLEQTGKNYKGLCPFHKEKTPSFVVSPDKQVFHCYGCGVGGNVFSFLMQYEKYSFPEAIRIVAGRVGVELPSRSQQDSAPQATRLERQYRLHAEVARYFAQQLTRSEQGRHAREYLAQRGIHQELAAKFSLGYALPGWDDVRNEFSRGYSQDLLLESGLLAQGKSGTHMYDRFRDRLMVPISDERGRVIAFGGRILGEGQPKYLNSPETPLFHKSRTLFGFHQAKEAIRSSGYVLIVEGYFDMIIPYSQGVRNVVATMGTALTPQHLRLLQRFTNKVILLFDGDSAGNKAVLRTLDLFMQSGFEARSGVLPPGEDPDSMIRRHGVETFRRHIEQAPLLLDFIRDRIVERHDLSNIEQQIVCANQILPTIVKIRDIVERNIQINKTADILKISDKALLEEFRKASRTGKIELRQTSVPSVDTHRPIPCLEQYLIKALLKDKRLIPLVKAELDVRELSHPVTRKVVEALCVFGDKTDFEAKILDMFQEVNVRNELTKLFVHADDVIEADRTVHDCLRRLRQQRFEHTTLDLTRKVRNAQEQSNVDSIDAFLEQKNRDLLKKRAQFG